MQIDTLSWQESALDALLVWLLDEPAHVARYMAAADGVAQLGMVLEARSNSSFVNMLDPLAKIVYASNPVSRGQP